MEGEWALGGERVLGAWWEEERRRDTHDRKGNGRTAENNFCLENCISSKCKPDYLMFGVCLSESAPAPY